MAACLFWNPTEQIHSGHGTVFVNIKASDVTGSCIFSFSGTLTENW